MADLDSESKKDSKAKAAHFWQILKNKKCNIYHFMIIDIMDCFGTLWQLLQKQSSTIMWVKQVIEGFMVRLDQYAQPGNTGPKLHQMLLKAQCGDDEQYLTSCARDDP